MQGGVRQNADQADASAAINQSDAAPGQTKPSCSARGYNQARVPLLSAKDGDTFHVSGCLVRLVCAGNKFLTRWSLTMPVACMCA